MFAKAVPFFGRRWLSQLLCLTSAAACVDVLSCHHLIGWHSSIVQFWTIPAMQYGLLIAVSHYTYLHVQLQQVFIESTISESQHLFVLCAGWQHSEKSVASPKLPNSSKETVTILHRLHFTSALKRMATLVKVCVHCLPNRMLCRR